MKYRFNEQFSLGHQEVPGYGAVYFVSKGHRDDIVILDESSVSLLNKARQLGVIDVAVEKSAATIKRLTSEQILIPVEASVAWTSQLYAESLNFWVQVTDTCNLACSYCYIPSLNSKRELRPDLFNLLERKLLRVEGLKTVHIKIAGGEPLLAFNKWREGVVKLQKVLASHGIELQLRLITNLTVLTEAMIEFIKDHGISVSVSLDGLTDFNDRNRIYSGSQKGSFAAVNKNIKLLQAAAISPSVMVTVTSENHAGVPDLIRYLVDNDITFRIADAKGGHIKPDEFESAMRHAANVLQAGVAAGFPISRRIVVSDLRTLSASPTPCSMGKGGAAIYLDGSVYFCHTEFEKGKPIGHLDENENLLGIIQRGKQKHFGLSEDCQSCEYRLICAGGCPLYRVNGKSPMCQSYKKIIKRVFELYEQEQSGV